jgi:hypothetical protein
MRLLAGKLQIMSKPVDANVADGVDRADCCHRPSTTRKMMSSVGYRSVQARKPLGIIATRRANYRSISTKCLTRTLFRRFAMVYHRSHLAPSVHSLFELLLPHLGLVQSQLPNQER